MLRLYNCDRDRETVQEKLEYEIFSEQCFEQAKEEEMTENKPIIEKLKDITNDKIFKTFNWWNIICNWFCNNR